ncbi:unnamed protein product [Citrullus colocynthis]|uniref:Uncharacterized protein n=1 Tax=Citrullus colocynthis TaxID=252529 RepID=A0ABP0XZL2_9ROSI
MCFGGNLCGRSLSPFTGRLPSPSSTLVRCRHRRTSASSAADRIPLHSSHVSLSPPINLANLSLSRDPLSRSPLPSHCFAPLASTNFGSGLGDPTAARSSDAGSHTL